MSRKVLSRWVEIMQTFSDITPSNVPCLPFVRLHNQNSSIFFKFYHISSAAALHHSTDLDKCDDQHDKMLCMMQTMSVHYYCAPTGRANFCISLKAHALHRVSISHAVCDVEHLTRSYWPSSSPCEKEEMREGEREINKTA